MPRVFWTGIWPDGAQDNIWTKLDRLWEAAGFSELVGPGVLVAIKAPLQGLGSPYYLRPLFVRAVVEMVLAAGGSPVVTDTTNLLWDRDGASSSWYEYAAVKGYTPASCGAPLVIANGYSGEDGVLVSTGGEELGGVEVAQVVAEAGAVIVLAHVTGHPLAGLAGALFSLGAECLTGTGQQKLYAGLKPVISQKRCRGCGTCIAVCPWGALEESCSGLPVLRAASCRGCLKCLFFCPHQAVTVAAEEKKLFQRRLAEAASGVWKAARGRVGVIGFLLDITSQPPCCPYPGSPLVTDIGLLASRDPVAADSAAISLVRAAPGPPGNPLPPPVVLEEGFLEAAEALGLGERSCRLEEVSQGVRPGGRAS